jgi:glycosyltransferase involved in cell wall biosynthesis
MKFTIVTPTFNSELYLQETIRSVISQKGDFLIEYVIVDNQSTDATLKIVEQFQYSLKTENFSISCKGVALRYICEQDEGMYDAINRGFHNATGDIYAWINSDDIYLPGAFDAIAKAFQSFPEILWLKGITSYINEQSAIYSVGECYLYRQDWIAKGLYGTDLYFIQQDSVFWRSELWLRSGGVDSFLKMAGDYFLWIKFAKLASLYSIKAYVSCFRKSQTQKSVDMVSYMGEIETHFDKCTDFNKKFRLFNRLNRLTFGKIDSLIQRIIFGAYEYKLLTYDAQMKLKLIESQYADVMGDL